MNVIGQEHNKSIIDNWEYIPNSLIIEGAKGSGKKLITKYICKKFGADYILLGSKVDNIREMILDAAQLNYDRVYIIDGTNMSIGAKNTLLKVTEESPKNCHIVVTVTSIQQSLPTLISRSQILSMDPYTVNDYEQYLSENLTLTDNEDISEYTKLGTSFGDYKRLLDGGIKLYLDKTNQFLDSIWKVTYANSLKIVDWLKIKKKDEEDSEKLECDLFVQCVLNVFHSDAVKYQEDYNWDELEQNYKFISATSKCLRQLYKKGTSKEITINNWLKELTELG